ncbi:acyl-CoA N-acyltransferase [Pelagophyceae sp. CCMP2097]|nr:acyl-CoA N-acyltransferase [Pelagophyceae sp. CCMP2097]
MPRAHKSHKKAPPPPPPPQEVNEDPDGQPFAVGANLTVRWTPDASARLCTIVDRTKIVSDDAPKEGEPSLWRYYVHYHDFNRRMDEWILESRVLEPPTVALARAQVAKERKVSPESDGAEASSKETAPEDEVEKDAVTLVATNMSHQGDSSSDFASGSGALDFGRRRKKKRAPDASKSLDGKMAVTAVEDMEHDEHEGLDEASLREHEEVTKVKNVGSVELGRHVMETWYFSPYPKDVYPGGYTAVLYVCEHSFAFFKNKRELLRWQARPQARLHPPGSEIYRHNGIAMFEVDGADHGTYCQNLCYFAKLFLDHKTLYYDVDPFLFYVLCERDEFGYHPVGYYSKEKYSEVGYNLACILTFPSEQRKGYGRFLISFSYELSRKECKVGAPEKPLSDLGHISYRAYWSSTILRVLQAQPAGAQALSVMDLSRATSIMADDIVATLQYLGLIRSVHGTYVLWGDSVFLDALSAKHPVKQPDVEPSELHWTPYLTDIKRDKFSVRSKDDPSSYNAANAAAVQG